MCIWVGRLTAEQGGERDALEQLELSTIDSGGDRVTGVKSAQGEALALWIEDCVLRAGGICIVPHLERAVDGGGAGRHREGQDAGEGGDLHLEWFVRLAGWTFSFDWSRSSCLADREPEERRMECLPFPFIPFSWVLITAPDSQASIYSVGLDGSAARVTLGSPGSALSTEPQ